MSVLYGIISIMALILVGVCVAVDRKKDIWLLLLFVSVFICNIGYFMLSVSKTLEMALTANRIAYLGNVFLPFFMLMMLLNLCGFKSRRWVCGLLLGIGMVVLMIAASQGYMTVYYSEVSLEITDSGSKLAREYGPLHGLYYVYLFLYFAAMLAIVGFAIVRKKINSYIHSIMLLSAVFINILVWLAEKFMTRDFEYLSVAYILSETLILFLYGTFWQYNMKRRMLCTWILGFFGAGIAVLCELVPENSSVYGLFNVFCSLICMGMYYAWGRTVCQGIIQKTQRRCLGGITALMIFWLFVSTCKNFIFISDAEVSRFLWYIYYVPQIFIAVLSLLAALMSGKGEDAVPGKWSGIIFGGGAAMTLLVMTNDLHQFFFSFPHNGPWTINSCELQPGYYMILAAILGAGAFALYLFIKKCRVPGKKKLAVFPVLAFVMIGIYGSLYFTKVGFADLYLGDMTAVCCLLIAAVFEFLMESRLLQVNIGYENLFKKSTLAALITDEEHRIRYSSEDAEDLPAEILKKADQGPVLLNQSVRLSGAAIGGGHIYWQENVAALLSVQKELEIAQEELRDTGDVLKAESEQKSYRLHLELENSLYDTVERQTARQIAALRELTAQLQKTEDLERAKGLLGKIVVIGTYLKRRSNLIFVAGQEGTVPAEELVLCVNESAESLKLYGIRCRTEVKGSRRLPPEIAYDAYDLLEAVIEKSLDSGSAILFCAEAEADGLHLSLCADCTDDLAELCQAFPGISVWQDEDSLWYLKADFDDTLGQIPDERREKGVAGL